MLFFGDEMQYSFVFASGDSNLVKLMTPFNKEVSSKMKFFQVPLERDFSTFTFSGCADSDIDLILEDSRFDWFAKKFIENLLFVRPKSISIQYLTDKNPNSAHLAKRDGGYFTYWDDIGLFKEFRCLC